MSCKRFAAVLVLALTSAIAAHATPISGQFSIAGASVADNGTTLTFNSPYIFVGAPDTLYGSFSQLLTASEAGYMTASINYANYVPNSAGFTFSSSNDSLHFSLTSLSEQNVGSFTLFTGTGTLSTNAAGYDPTAATILFSTQGSGNTTFSATTYASPVPEPSTLALLGTGLVGVAGAARRKFLGA